MDTLGRHLNALLIAGGITIASLAFVLALAFLARIGLDLLA